MSKKEQPNEIHIALGLSKDWKILNEAYIEEDVNEGSTVTDVMEKIILRLKTECFGEDNYTISEYEKKLIYAGFMLSNDLTARRTISMMSSMIQNEEDEDDN